MLKPSILYSIEELWAKEEFREPSGADTDVTALTDLGPSLRRRLLLSWY